MNHLLEPELEREQHTYSLDREISLGPGTILGLFFVLALICACFFGFGYSVGHRSAVSAAIPAVILPPASTSGAAKPSAGSSAAAALPVAAAPEPAGIPSDAAVATSSSAAATHPAAALEEVAT